MSNMKQSTKFCLDMGPLLIFFASYKFYDLVVATACLIVATIVAVAISYRLEKKVPMMLLVSAIVLTIFGGLTVISNDEIFIKIKPTLVNILFAVVLIGGYLYKKPLLKYLLESAIKMPEEAWLKFSLRWGLFFLFLAAVNEIVWRNFSTDFWVQFKVFGMLPLTLVFTLSQMPFLKKYMFDEMSNK